MNPESIIGRERDSVEWHKGKSRGWKESSEGDELYVEADMCFFLG